MIFARQANTPHHARSTVDLAHVAEADWLARSVCMRDRAWARIRVVCVRWRRARSVRAGWRPLAPHTLGQRAGWMPTRAPSGPIQTKAASLDAKPAAGREVDDVILMV